MLILKINFKKYKLYYFNIFSNKKKLKYNYYYDIKKKIITMVSNFDGTFSLLFGVTVLP